ncbi:MAG: HAMP domain-containing histidine kinase [Defluviitaleaceae bacterium]|nr:HAMP domain-containing histidine kinase [Defluviitaleaceae bacterium]
MKLFSRISRNLRASIFTSFSALLFFSFVLIGVAFNFAANQYIERSAKNALIDARNAHLVGVTVGAAEMFYSHIVAEGGSVNFFHRNLMRLYVDPEHQLAHVLGSPAVPYTVVRDITGVLEGENVDLSARSPRRIRANGNIYYVTTIRAMVTPPVVYAVYYINVTDLRRFTAGINMRLLALVAIIWFATMVMSTILSGALAKPLKNLSQFAGQIGQGNFEPNPITFANEEFEELNQSLNHAAKQLARYDNDQKTFFQNVSHELRTPLMSIKSYAEGIKYGVMDNVMAAETILECTDRLTEMVGDILYVSRIDNITAPLMEEVNLAALIEERVARQQSLAERRNITLDFKTDGEPIIISCVISYIERAVDNLISNAIRHAQGTVTLECFTIGSKATIRVLDDGTGFEPDALPNIFERFFKGKNGLTGIGLSIVKSVVEQHKGTATAENGENGAIMTISLPRVV